MLFTGVEFALVATGLLAREINAISPGLTESGMTAGLDQRPELADDLIALIPMGRMGLSQNIADGVVWMCGDTASFVTGHVLVIDGGQTIA
jgi:NAD(P)-dependent dehydrogenase (short-subunit alcohol dehydrogenase family)